MTNIIYILLLFITLLFIIFKFKPLYLFDENGYCRSEIMLSIVVLLLFIWCYLFVKGINENIV